MLFFPFSNLGGVLSPEAHDFSLDESFDSEDDSDHYDDYSSDAGNASYSDLSLNSCTKHFYGKLVLH